jgi:hypothetical protein
MLRCNALDGKKNKLGHTLGYYVNNNQDVCPLFLQLKLGTYIRLL